MWYSVFCEVMPKTKSKHSHTLITRAGGFHFFFPPRIPYNEIYPYNDPGKRCTTESLSIIFSKKKKKYTSQRHVCVCACVCVRRGGGEIADVTHPSVDRSLV